MVAALGIFSKNTAPFLNDIELNFKFGIIIVWRLNSVEIIQTKVLRYCFNLSKTFFFL